MNIDRTNRPDPVYRMNRDHVPQKLAGQPMTPIGGGPDPTTDAPRIVRALSGPRAAADQPPLNFDTPHWPGESFDRYA